MQQGLAEGNPIANAIRERDPAALEKISKKISNALAEKFGSASCKAPLPAIVFMAEKLKPQLRGERRAKRFNFKKS